MNETTFITLLDWMVDKLHLSGNELVIYGIIHGFSQDGHSVYYGSISYLAKKSGISDRSVLTVLQKLVAKKLIIKEDVKEYIVTSNEGKQELKKAQGGANHFCIYYTKVSRLHNYCEVIPTVYLTKSVIEKPTEDSSHGIKTPTEDSSYGNDVPTEVSSHGKIPPTEDISYAATEDSSYNNKLYSIV